MTTVADPPTTAPPPHRHRLLEWVILVVVVVVAALLVKTYVLEAYVVPSGSMIPTIQVNDRILVDKLAFDFGSKPEIGEIVVFHKAPADLQSDTPILVKRIVGLPGERLQSGPDGEIIVDGRPIPEPWLTPAEKASPGPAICATGNSGEVSAATQYCHNGVLTLPPGEYWMMGDNRAISDDSRYWGPLPGHLIIGQVFLRIWPLDRIHWF